MKNTHGNGQRVEHLPHGSYDCHPREIRRIRDQEILHAAQCSRSGNRIDCDDHGQHYQDRHHNAGYALDTVADTGVDDSQSTQSEYDKAQLCRDTIGNKRGKITVRCQIMSVTLGIFHQIFDHPSADDGIIRNDQNRNNSVDPSAEGQPFGFPEGMKGTYGTFTCHASQ